MIISQDDKIQFQYILPSTGNLNTLKVVDSIVKKLEKNDIEEEDILFDDIELRVILASINILDEQAMIRYSSLSLVQKILSTEEK